jgi:hypothetical protein
MTTIVADWHNGDLFAGTNALSLRGFEGYDIHVLRNTTSLPLRSILMLLEDNNNLTRADSATLPADVNGILFLGQFAAAGPQQQNSLSGHGVRLDIRTGEVTATPNPPTPQLRSFIVTATVQRTGLAPLQIPIRFLIHESVTEIWLTPSTLTLPGDAAGQRLSVLARFDDDTIGDITRLAAAPTAPGQPLESGFTWTSSDNVCVRVDQQGRLSGNFALTSCSSTITATLRQPGWPTLSANAQVTVIEPWAERRLSQRDLTLVGGPGLTVVNEVPNVLLLPDGFLDTPEDRADFDRLASLAVHRLNTSGSTTPFDLLSGSINFWSAFLPSRERGTTALPELVELPTLFDGPIPQSPTPVTTLAVDGARSAGDFRIDFRAAALIGNLPVEVHFRIGNDPTLYTTTNNVTAAGNALRGVEFKPVLAQNAANNAVVAIIGQRGSINQLLSEATQALAALPNLVGVVGLPVPAERLTQRSTAPQLQAKITEWTTLYGAARITPLNVTNVLYDAWARFLPDHRLADEKDTALGMANEERPRALRKTTPSTLSWHPLRTIRTELDLFLATLEFDGTVIGQTWTIPTGGQPGKDRALVFVLVRGIHNAGSNTEGTQPIVTMTLVDQRTLRVDYGAGRSMQIVSHDLLRDRGGVPALTNFVHATIAHEAAHSFGLADEYGGAQAMSNAGADVQRTFNTGNVTPGGEVQAPAGITGASLRWRWPRILRAAVLAAPPDLEPGTTDVFTIRLQPGHPRNAGLNLFQVGDTVHLRQRPLVRPSTATPPTLTVALESPALTIISPTRTLATDELQARLQSGTINRADFSATGNLAPILFTPRPASAVAAAAGDRYAEVMAQFIRAHITNGRPLNASPAGPTYICRQPTGVGIKAAQAAINLPATASFPGGRLPAIPSRIVGAYEGGATFNCNVFHPAGTCIMREQLADRAEQAITSFNQGDVHPFCPVCRYIIVDNIDPRLHGDIDALYFTYPQP